MSKSLNLKKWKINSNKKGLPKMVCTRTLNRRCHGMTCNFRSGRFELWVVSKLNEVLALASTFQSTDPKSRHQSACIQFGTISLRAPLPIAYDLSFHKCQSIRSKQVAKLKYSECVWNRFNSCAWDLLYQKETGTDHATTKHLIDIYINLMVGNNMVDSNLVLYYIKHQ